MRWVMRNLCIAALSFVAVGAVAPRDAGAQSADRLIEGQVQRALPGGATRPVAGEWAVLHRVGRDAAAPLDSMRTRANGRYAFRYRATGDSNAVYFVSTMRGGVAYFTPPTREPSVSGGMADLLVYDTTSAPIPITVRSRSVILTAPDSATGSLRSVIEVYELANDSSFTRVPRGTELATFSLPLPAAVTSVVGGQGDISPEAIQVIDGRVHVYAPFAPGLKQFSFSYDVPASQPLVAPVEGEVPAIEVLIEDPRGTATGVGVQEVDPVQVDGRPFKRFLARDVAAAGDLVLTAPGEPVTANNLRVMFVVTAIGAAMLLGLGMSFLRGGPQAFARRRNADPESLALEIAALDAAFEAKQNPSEQDRAEHYVRRAQLKGRLSAALAKRDGLA